MKIYCTTCCKEKAEDAGEIPAVERYISPRIDFVFEQSIQDHFPFRILSGKYGVLKPEQPIPWYDKRLEDHEVSTVKQLVKQQLSDEGISNVIFFGQDPAQFPEWEPYYRLIRESCEESGIIFEIHGLSDDIR